MNGFFGMEDFITNLGLSLGCLVRMQRKAWLRPVTKAVYEQPWFHYQGPRTHSKGVRKLSPFGAYAEGLVKGTQVESGEILLVSDWSRRVPSRSLSWEEEERFTLELIYRTKLLYLDLDLQGPNVLKVAKLP